jgi:hypothetical protein
MVAAADDIVQAGERVGLAIRAIGGIAVWDRLSSSVRAMLERVRSAPRDVDLLAAGHSEKKIKTIFAEEPSYAPDERLNAWHGHHRQRYFKLDDHGEVAFEIDVFIGKPPLCHDIDFSDRLDTDGFAMAPTDLLLQKLQVHDADQKDLLDAACLLADYSPQDGQTERAIEVERITALTSHDWGFWYTATSNLEKALTVTELLDDPVRGSAAPNIRLLATRIGDAPKSRRWKMRARVGTRIQWYEDVEELGTETSM